MCLCHKNPEQINLLTGALMHPDIDIYLHIDKKAQMQDLLKKGSHVFMLPDQERIDVQWASISQVTATLHLIRYARKKKDYDYFWLISGQDFPIKSIKEIYTYILNRHNKNFINLFSAKRHNLKRNELFYPQWLIGKAFYKRVLKRLLVGVTGGYYHTFAPFKRHPLPLDYYFGSQWWCLSKEVIEWMLQYLQQNPSYYAFFQNSVCPDECFFQTLFMNSPYRENREEHLTYVNWKENSISPDILTVRDYKELMNSSYLMARKFDINVDKDIIDKFCK